MRTLLLILACSLFVAALAARRSLAFMGDTTIGMYITEAPTRDRGRGPDAPAGGLYTAYLVCADPENTSGDAITTLGGYECELSISGGWSFQSVVLPPDVLDLDTSLGSFYCSGLMPVSGGFVTLATVSLLNYTPAKGWVWIAPYGPAPASPVNGHHRR